MCWYYQGFPLEHREAVVRVENSGKQSFEEDDRLRAKRHLRNDSRRDKTGRVNAEESASTSSPKASAKRDAELRNGSYTLTGWELHERELKLRSDLIIN